MNEQQESITSIKYGLCKAMSEAGVSPSQFDEMLAKVASLPAWYGSEASVSPDGKGDYGVYHGVYLRDREPGWLARLFFDKNFILKENAAEVVKKLNKIKGLTVDAESDPDMINFAHGGPLTDQMKEQINEALATKVAFDATKITNPFTSVISPAFTIALGGGALAGIGTAALRKKMEDIGKGTEDSDMRRTRMKIDMYKKMINDLKNDQSALPA